MFVFVKQITLTLSTLLQYDQIHQNIYTLLDVQTINILVSSAEHIVWLFSKQIFFVRSIFFPLSL